MRKVYVWMTLALVITGVTACGVASSPNLMITHLYEQNYDVGPHHFAELHSSLVLQLPSTRLSLATATMLFILYSVINGAMLSTIFVAYSPMVIARCSSSPQAHSDNGCLWIFHET